MNADPGRSGRIYIRDIYIYTFVTSFGIVLWAVLRKKDHERAAMFGKIAK
jgi:hypothetical protein